MSNSNYVIGKPEFFHIPQLRKLWKDTFEDTDKFLDVFHSTAFSLERCRCVLIHDVVVAALYWFDCTFMNQPIAYIYAVATAKAFRGQGLCHALMDNTHKHLEESGYVGALLSPASETLFDFYENIGYKTCAFRKEIIFDEDTLHAFEAKKIAIRKIDKDEFAKFRPQFLPKNAVLQEHENLDFLETQATFYAGDDFLLTAQQNESHLQGIEFLGDASAIPSILQKLNCTSGVFHTLGKEKPCGMYYSFTDNTPMPSYFGFTFE